MAKVFSINDFKEGLDLRKSPLTAPGGSLRILDNCWITQGGEIAKRAAFVPVATLPPEAGFIAGHGRELHVFGAEMGPVNSGSSPFPLVGHSLAPATFGGTGPAGLTRLTDVEAFDDGWYVVGADGSYPAPDTCIWWNDALVLEVDGTHSHGMSARTWKTKMYRVDRKYLRFSGINNPAENDPISTTSPGAGFINMARHDPDGEELVAMEVFYDRMAIFSRLLTQMWTLDPDPVLDAQAQLIRIGTVAPRSVFQFGTGDILFLSDSGVRSLRAQTITITAAVTDVGSAIDPILTDLIRTNPGACQRAFAVVQPIAGRYWLAIADKIYVLSFFPAGNITAWSVFSPGFEVQEFAVVQNRVYCRDQNNVVYLFGGPDNQAYDSCRVTVRTPHHSIDEPTQRKRVQSVDVMCQGAWSVSLGMLPNNTDAFELVANVVDNTYGIQSIPFAGYGTHIGLELVHEAPGPALLAAVHLNIQEASVK